jgi:hypothetical protein
MSSFAASDNSVAVAPIQDTDDSQELVQRTQVSNEVADGISQTNPGNSATLSLEDCQRLALVHIGPDSKFQMKGSIVSLHIIISLQRRSQQRIQQSMIWLKRTTRLIIESENLS